MGCYLLLKPVLEGEVGYTSEAFIVGYLEERLDLKILYAVGTIISIQPSIIQSDKFPQLEMTVSGEPSGSPLVVFLLLDSTRSP